MINFNQLLTGKLAGKKLTNHAKSALIASVSLAAGLQEKEIHSVHLLYAIYTEKGSLGANILRDLGIKTNYFPSSFFSAKKRAGQKRKREILISEDLRKAMTKSWSLAKKLGYSYVGTEHLIYALLHSKEDRIRKILANTIPPRPLKKLPLENNPIFSREILSEPSTWNHDSFFPNTTANQEETFLTHLEEMITLNKKTAKMPKEKLFTEKFCVNVNKEAEERQETIVGREVETNRIISILGRKNKNNPLLIGQPGVGKTALISRLAQLINSGQVPSYLIGKTILNLDVASLIAGTSFRGEFESRLKNIIAEIKENKNIILFIDEIHNIIGAGNIAGSLDLANIIKPAMSRGEIQLMGATTMAEYKKYIEKDSALERRFQPVIIKEPELEEARKILLGIKKDYETFHNVIISPEAINLAVDLSNRYIQGRYLPDKAIDVLDETAACVRSRKKFSDFTKPINEVRNSLQKIAKEKEQLVSEEQYEKAIALRNEEKKLEEKLNILKKEQEKIEKKNCVLITGVDIIETMSKISQIPQEKLAQEKNHKIKNISQVLSKSIIGQEDTMEKISNILIRSQFGINCPDRPLGSFLFLGPTGVGKTLTAKILSREFFGRDRSLIKIDMSEFMERHSLSALIGSPAGYVGYGEGGRLTEKVRHNPYSVVLFDEVEKAHPDIHNILLQILEDGVLTDAEGKEVSFKNTIIILTSNIELNDYAELPLIGFFSNTAKKKENSDDSALAEVTRELERILRPELLGRLDHILVFNTLKEEALSKIALLELEKLSLRLLQNNLSLKTDKEIPKHLAKHCLRQNQGARPIRRLIQEAIENPIARMIMGEKIKDGKVRIGLVKGKIKVN